MLFRQLVFYALLVGILAGIAVTAVQTFQVVPIILAAEQYEGANAAAQENLIPAMQSAGHHAAVEEEEWAPADGFERTAFTALANVLTAMGFSLVLLAVMVAAAGLPGRNRWLQWWHGLLWGAAGYLTFWLAPAIGLPPEIPMQNAAALEHRQIWWMFAVLCTAGGLAGLAFGKSPWRWAAPVLIVIPHLVGAPHPEGVMFPDQAPAVAAALEELAQQFLVATAIANAVLWLVIGLVSVWSVKRILVAVEKAEAASGGGVEAPSV
jgi:cobalt transporter subunit CbtA